MIKIHEASSVDNPFPDCENKEDAVLSLKDFKITLSAEQIDIKPSGGYDGMRHQSLILIIDHPKSVIKEPLKIILNDFLQDYALLNEERLPESTREAYAEFLTKITKEK